MLPQLDLKYLSRAEESSDVQQWPPLRHAGSSYGQCGPLQTLASCLWCVLLASLRVLLRSSTPFGGLLLKAPPSLLGCTLVRRVCMRDIRRLALGGSEGLDPCRSTYKTALARTVWLLEACRADHRPA